MRHLLLYLILSVSFYSSFSQNTGIGVGTTNPHSSAAFEIKDSIKGFLPPRMTFNQRNSISNPAQGLIIYCIDCGNNGGEPQFFNGSTWLNFLGGTAQVGPANLPSVIIGTQIWQSKNLDVATYSNGVPIPQVTDPTQWANLTTGAWCWYNNDSATYAATYGRLYNWYAVADPRGLCPTGWHVPSDGEWTTLESQFGGSSMVATSLKSISGWVNNTNGTNTSGFTGLPGGTHSSDGNFYNFGYLGYIWSATEIISDSAWSRVLGSNVYRNSYKKQAGMSVRCLRD